MSKLPKWIAVKKNPSSWMSAYSVVLWPSKAKMTDRFTSRNVVASQHKSKETATAQAGRLVRKYGTAKNVWDKYLGWDAAK